MPRPAAAAESRSGLDRGGEPRVGLSTVVQEGQRQGRQAGATWRARTRAGFLPKAQYPPYHWHPPTCVVMESESCRAASSADSFTRLASSAPLKPGVRRASSSAGGNMAQGLVE